MKFLNHNNLKFFRERCAEVLRRAFALATRRPELALSLVAGLFYVYQLAHLPLVWLCLFVWFALAVTYGLVYFARRVIARRLSGDTVRLGPELLIAGVLIVAIYLTDFFRISWFVVLLPGAFWLWLLWAAWARRVGTFYTGFIALLLFGLAVFVYRMLFIQELALGYGSYYLQRAAAVRELEQGYRWEQSGASAGTTPGAAGDPAQAASTHSLYLGDRPVLHVEAPIGVTFHDARLISFIYGVPEPGIGICYLSASQQDPFSPPAVGIFQADPAALGIAATHSAGSVDADDPTRATDAAPVSNRLNPKAEAYLRDVVERALLLRRRNGEIDQLEYRGQTELPEYLRLVDIGQSRGIYYTYYDRVLEEHARLGLYVTPNARFVLVINDAPQDGDVAFEPVTFAILRGIRTP